MYTQLRNNQGMSMYRQAGAAVSTMHNTGQRITMQFYRFIIIPQDTTLVFIWKEITPAADSYSSSLSGMQYEEMMIRSS